ncbi:MAG: sortase [Ruthenibacterium sp.]
MHKSKRGLFKICMGMLFLACACGFWQQNSADARAAATASSAMLAAFNAQIMPPTAAENPQKTPAVCDESVDICGVLTIPALSLQLPIQADYSAELLQNAPCRYPAFQNGDAKQIFCAHNYKGQFGGLQKLAVGDAVFFVDANGIEQHYTVSKVTTIAEDDVAALTADGCDLALFTCAQNERRRVLVCCQNV